MKTYTEEQIKYLISVLDKHSADSHGKSQKWAGTNATYGDSGFSAADALFGEYMAFEHAAGLLKNLIKSEENIDEK